VEAQRDPFEVALTALRRKERTSRELAEWLERRGFGSEDVEAALGRLAAAGELDDERFAQSYADDKRSLSGWGAERIRDALLAKGIDGATVDAVMAGDSRADQLERLRGGAPVVPARGVAPRLSAGRGPACQIADPRLRCLGRPSVA
jgi:SOS response regulatory protein OraA/RecX